ncbi:hypothetical protein Marky_1201 [Marinithermus hydrothermalis DSM 14884]|uniref:Uncharacterized protein n=1 Tax=Marinithermus hydrothermalis (strain DSM 14884 / JCM 11576 / T1) TaxID=869210 RepID=F2NQK3_MARHT|nr:hypothetical protein Marky_1201 [Marinithermus hydrothermalis DSM 14884]
MNVLRIVLYVASLLAGVALAQLLPEEATRGVLYCPDGIYPLTGDPLPAKVYRKGTLVRVVLPYDRANWSLPIRYGYRNGQPVRYVLRTPRPFPDQALSLVTVCYDDGNGREMQCRDLFKGVDDIQYDPTAHVLWISFHYGGPIKRLEATVHYADGRCGGHVRYVAVPPLW